MTAVAQMGAHAGAGFDGRLNASRVGGRVTQGHYHTRRRQAFDENNGALQLRGQRHQTNPSSRGVLEPAEFVPVRLAHELPRMSAARTLLGRDVWPFQMNSLQRLGQLDIFLASLPQSAHAMVKGGKAIGHQRRAEACDPVDTANVDHVADAVFVEPLGIEAMAVAAVDLHIE